MRVNQCAGKDNWAWLPACLAGPIYISRDKTLTLTLIIFFVAEMTNSEIMYEEYGQMVAEHMERRKKAEVQVNNDIRGNYIDKLGLNNRVGPTSETATTTDSNQGNGRGTGANNRASMTNSIDTYGPNRRSSANTTIASVRDTSAPREVNRTLLTFNQGKATEIEANGPHLSRQSSNIAGYFSTTPSSQAGGPSNRFSMPVKEANRSPILVKANASQSALLQEDDTLNY